MAFKLIYTDVALGAANDAEITAATPEEFCAPDKIPFGVYTGAVATCEPNAWGLTHTYKVKDKQPFAFWSIERSGEGGVFEQPPALLIEFTEQYTSTGLTFRFSPDANEYCSEIFVAWYQDGAIKESGYFYPNNGEYALENTVEAFDQVAVAFTKTNLPHRRVKLEYVAIGIIREFDGSELTDAKCVHEIDIISDTVPINVLDASFHSSTDAEFMFQKKQPVEAYNGTDLVGVYYIESGERISARNYSISCHDAIGVLELDAYNGGLYLTDTPLETICDDVLGGAFAVEIDAAYANTTLRGYIPPGTKREALRHIGFALGACIDTTGTFNIKIFPPSVGKGVEIPKTETYIGGKVTTTDIVTAVSVVSYEIVDKRPEDGDEAIEINGVEYKYTSDIATATNPNVSVGTLPNALTFDGCYLINSTNAQERADNILAYYMRRNTYSAKHIVRGQNMADRSVVHLPWDDVKTGNIIKMTITATAITASDTEFLLD